MTPIKSHVSLLIRNKNILLASQQDHKLYDVRGRRCYTSSLRPRLTNNHPHISMLATHGLIPNHQFTLFKKPVVINVCHKCITLTFKAPMILKIKC